MRFFGAMAKRCAAAILAVSVFVAVAIEIFLSGTVAA